MTPDRRVGPMPSWSRLLRALILLLSFAGMSVLMLRLFSFEVPEEYQADRQEEGPIHVHEFDTIPERQPLELPDPAMESDRSGADSKEASSSTGSSHGDGLSREERHQLWVEEMEQLGHMELARLAEESRTKYDDVLQMSHTERYASGKFEVIGLAKKLILSREEQAAGRKIITVYTAIPQGGGLKEHRKTVFPPEEYPALYELRDRIFWLRNAVALRRPR